MAGATATKGLAINIDVKGIDKVLKMGERMLKATKPILTKGVNEIGDALVSLVATDLAKQTGLTLEQVRGFMTVKPAKVSQMTYEVKVDPRLYEGDAFGRQLEGRREDRDFGHGRRDPGALVIIVSKKDELVCEECEALEAAGPMPVEVAAAHIPAHPNCRCIIMPYVQKGKRIGVTMTTVSGTDPRRRVGGRGATIHADVTLRQLAQNVMNRAAQAIRIELK